jgi:hypothetical protein
MPKKPKTEDNTIQPLHPLVMDIAYDAACIWEWAVGASDVVGSDMANMFARRGTGDMRVEFMNAIPYVRKSFEQAKAAGYEDCFDWEFVPWFMENCVDMTLSEWAYDTSKLPPGCVPPSEPVLEGTVNCFALFSGGEPVGTVTEEGKPTQWETFATAREAQLEILGDLEEHIRQFKAGERDYDEIVMPPDCYAQEVTLHPDGGLVTEDGEFEPPEQH